jgi:hypothetical protein
MKRELGAELESITDIWRRYLYRGAAGKSPGPLSRSAGRSPAPPLTSTPAREMLGLFLLSVATGLVDPDTEKKL